MNYVTNFPYSAIFYSFVLVFSVLFAFAAQIVKNKITSKIMMLMVVLILSLTAGFRDSTVGIDTEAYIRIIQSTSPFYSGELYYKYVDIGFQILVKLLLQLLSDPHYVLFCVSLITNALIISTIWQLKDKISFSISIFIYITFFYFETFNILRQWLAIAIIFFAFRYLIRSKYVFFTTFVLIASTIHLSAIIAMVFIPIHVLVEKKSNIKIKIIGILITLAMTIAFIIFGYEILIGKYIHYLSNIGFYNGNLGLLFLVRLALLVFAVFLYLKRDFTFNDIVFQKLIISISVFGLFISVFSYMYLYAGRIATYATSFQILLYSMMNKTKSLSLIIKFIIIPLGLYLFYTGLVHSTHGQMPYKVFFE